MPTFVIAGFMVLMGKREYIVAEKKGTIKNWIKDKMIEWNII